MPSTKGWNRKTPGLREVVVHIDPEDDDQQQPSINLPLRPKIADAVNATFEKLQDTGFISQTDSPSNIVLHYLEGKLSVEIWIPLTNRSNTALARTIGTTVAEQLKQSTCPAEVTVLFVPRGLVTPRLVSLLLYSSAVWFCLRNNHFADSSA